MKTTLFRRLTSLLLIFAIVLSCSASALAYTCSNWAKRELAAAQAEGIIPASLSDKDMTLRLTRQEMCDIAVNTFEQMIGTSLYPSSTAHFTDTTNANICIAAELGIVNGYPDGTFRPNNTITRQEFAKVVENFYFALGWTTADLNDSTPAPEPKPEPEPEPEPAAVFADYANVSRWAKESANTVVGIGIIRGNTKNQLLPQGNSTREETLAMMLRTYKYMMNELGLPLPDAAVIAEPTTVVEEAPAADEPAAEPVEAPAEVIAEPSQQTEALTDDTTAEPTDVTETETPAVISDTAEIDVAAPVQSQAVTPTYTCSNWAKKEMAAAVTYGIMPESLLHADLTQKISRAEICYASVLTFMAITATAGEAESTDHFTDTADPMINLAFELGLVDGMTDGTFRPNELMTREQLFKIITNLLTATGWQEDAAEEPTPEPEEPEMETPVTVPAVDLNDVFTDAANIGRWAKSSVTLLYQLGVIKGDTKGRMNPTGNTTREEGMVMFLRAYQYIEPWYEENPLEEINGPIIADDVTQALVQFALQFEGYPYSYGDESPEDGFDCSGFIWYVFRQFGINTHRTAESLMDDGIHVEYNELRPGDIIGFWNSGHTYIGHVALYIGDGKMIHAESSGTGVCIGDIDPDSYYYGRYYEARRLIY